MKAKLIKDFSIKNIIKDFYIRGILKDVEEVFLNSKSKTMLGPSVEFINGTNNYTINHLSAKLYRNLDELLHVVKMVNRKEKDVIWTVNKGDFITSPSVRFKSVSKTEFEEQVQKFYDTRGKDPHYTND
jgi:hypothetical protein